METPLQPAPGSAVEASPATSLSHKTVRRFSAIQLLVVLVLWLVTAPVVWETRYGVLIEVILTTVVMLSAVLAVGARRKTLVLAALLVTPACACRWFNHARPDLMPPEVHLIAGIVFMLFVSVHLLRFILRAPRVNAEVLCAGVSGYLFIGLLWTLTYTLVAEVAPDSFAFNGGAASGRKMMGLESVYFSFVTLCTIGYGDISPVSPTARMLAILEATTGMFYMAVLIARLVAIHSVEKHHDTAGD